MDYKRQYNKETKSTFIADHYIVWLEAELTTAKSIITGRTPGINRIYDKNKELILENKELQAKLDKAIIAFEHINSLSSIFEDTITPILNTLKPPRMNKGHTKTCILGDELYRPFGKDEYICTCEFGKSNKTLKPKRN